MNGIVKNRNIINTMKLNQREQMVLKAIQDGERCIYYKYNGRFNPNAYYSIDGAGTCTRETKKLIKFGLIERVEKGFGDGDIIITEAGKNFKCELDEPYDVWVVTRESYRPHTVNKYSGFLNNTILTKSDGSKAREGNDRRFFKDRKEAFDYALELQESTINSLKGKLKWAENGIRTIENHSKNPDLDKAGYL